MEDEPTPEISTWEEWLALRPHPEPPPGDGVRAVRLSPADAVATALRYRLGHTLDFVHGYVRDGVRQLFDEFERDTAGQELVWGDPAQLLHQELTFEGLRWGTMSIGSKDVPVLVIKASNGMVLRVPLNPEQAALLAGNLYQLAVDCGFEDPGQDD